MAPLCVCVCGIGIIKLKQDFWHYHTIAWNNKRGQNNIGCCRSTHTHTHTKTQHFRANKQKQKLTIHTQHTHGQFDATFFSFYSRKCAKERQGPSMNMDIIMAWPEEKKTTPLQQYSREREKIFLLLKPTTWGPCIFRPYPHHHHHTIDRPLDIYTPHTHTQTPDSIRIYQKKTEPNRNAKQKKINQLHTQYTLMNINQTKPKKGT